jgi:starch phosphorylase
MSAELNPPPFWPAQIDDGVPGLEPALRPLNDLAVDLRWTWLHATDALWRWIDAGVWERTGNPQLVLRSASAERWATLAQDAGFRGLLDEIVAARAALDAGQRWFPPAGAGNGLRSIAYFCMEFGLTQVLPIYAGGLGVLAGDHLKAACELGVPIVAVGLLYSGGYFRQRFDETGAQREEHPLIDPDTLPLERVHGPDGAAVGVTIALPGRDVLLRAWRARIGQVSLYLLDANDVANAPEDRRITAELYGGDADMRLRQELALGVGGWRLLRALGYAPDVCHLNEGHAAFATVERAVEHAKERGLTFDAALDATRPGNVFTTHTAVSAGFDRFDKSLLAPYLIAYAQGTPLDPNAVWRLGEEPGGDTFNMAHLALHASALINAVSRLHGEVSRRLFARLFAGTAEGDVPISYITNGVHVPTWESSEARVVRDRGVTQTSDDELLALRAAGRGRLIETVRARAAGDFSPDALTLGWARRFATYKRPTLVLSDPDRLIRLLRNPDRPVQIVVAGKAHPRDEEGKALLREWVRFAQRPDVAGRVAVLEDYDMALAGTIVQGVDVWLNTPRRPWEASGTSGMKVACSGGLNVSELDGWWTEAYAPELGWAFSSVGDAEETGQLYGVLEADVVPAFYTREGGGRPEAWLRRMRASMSNLVPVYSADRMVRQYVEAMYLPAAAAAYV